MAEVWVVVGNVVRVVVVEASVVLVPDDRVEGEVAVVRAEDSFLACQQDMSRSLRSLKKFLLNSKVQLVRGSKDFPAISE